MDSDYGLNDIQNFLKGEAEDAAEDSDDADSVILGYQPIKQISKRDLLLMLESPNRQKAKRRKEIVTPSKITSLLDEEDDDEVSTSSESENDENATSELHQLGSPVVQTDQMSKIFGLSVSRPGNLTPQKDKRKDVLLDIKNVCNNKSQFKQGNSPMKTSTNSKENFSPFKIQKSAITKQQLQTKMYNSSGSPSKVFNNKECYGKPTNTKKIMDCQPNSDSMKESPLLMPKHRTLPSIAHSKEHHERDVPLSYLNDDIDNDIPLAKLKKAIPEESSDEDVPLIKFRKADLPKNTTPVPDKTTSKTPHAHESSDEDVPLVMLRKSSFLLDSDEDIPLAKLKQPNKATGSSRHEECMDGPSGNKSKEDTSSDDDSSSGQECEPKVKEGSSKRPGKNSSSEGSDEEDEDKRKRNGTGATGDSSVEEMDDEAEESSSTSSNESGGKLHKSKKKKKRVPPSRQLSDESSDDDDVPISKIKSNRKSPEMKKKSKTSNGKSSLKKSPLSKSSGNKRRQSKSTDSESSSQSDDSKVSARGKPQNKQDSSDSDDDKPLTTLKKGLQQTSKGEKQARSIQSDSSSGTDSDVQIKGAKKAPCSEPSSDSSDHDDEGPAKKTKSPKSKANMKRCAMNVIQPSKKNGKASASAAHAQTDSDSEDDKPLKSLKRQNDIESTSCSEDEKPKLPRGSESGKKEISREDHKKPSQVKRSSAHKESSSSSDSSNADDHSKTNVLKERKPQNTSKLSSSSASDSDDNRPLAKLKSNKNSKGKQSSESEEDKPLASLKKGNAKSASKSASRQDKKIEKLKRYLKEAGMNFVPYKKISEQCNGNGKKIAEKLLSLLHEKGLKGSPSIEKCRKLKKKLEIKKDVESLDLDNIIEDGPTRTRRSQVSAKPMKRKAESSDSEKEQAKKKYSRLLSLADNSSDE